MPQQALGQHGKPFDALSLIHLPRQQAEVPNSALRLQNWIVFRLEFSAPISRLGGAESDESIEIFGCSEGVYSQARR